MSITRLVVPRHYLIWASFCPDSTTSRLPPLIVQAFALNQILDFSG